MHFSIPHALHRLGKQICFFAVFVCDTILPHKHDVRQLSAMSAERALATLPRCKDQKVPAIFEYRDRRVKRLIWELKYRGNRNIARLIADVLCIHIYSMRRSKTLPEKTILMPIPLSRARRRERGFNQNELVIQEMVRDVEERGAPWCRLDIEFNALERVRHTAPQSSLARRAERLENLRGCFAVLRPELVRDKDIILLDDVVTTGSTLREARAVLLQAGARSVHCIAIAH